jgi:hypothetical protein
MITVVAHTTTRGAQRTCCPSDGLSASARTTSITVSTQQRRKHHRHDRAELSQPRQRTRPLAGTSPTLRPAQLWCSSFALHNHTSPDRDALMVATLTTIPRPHYEWQIEAICLDLTHALRLKGCATRVSCRVTGRAQRGSAVAGDPLRTREYSRADAGSVRVMSMSDRSCIVRISFMSLSDPDLLPARNSVRDRGLHFRLQGNPRPIRLEETYANCDALRLPGAFRLLRPSGRLWLV